MSVNCSALAKEGYRKPGLHCATASADGGMCPHVDLVYYVGELDRVLIKCIYPDERENS